ncbi:MAG: hypothetical protein ACR2QO_06470, partial [Acidimicrobiales bacterium]
MDKVEEIHAWIANMMELEVRSGPGDTGYTPEETPEEYPEMPEGTPEDYRAAMDQYLDEAGVPEDQREGVYDQLEAQGDYSADGYRQN